MDRYLVELLDRRGRRAGAREAVVAQLGQRVGSGTRQGPDGHPALRRGPGRREHVGTRPRGGERDEHVSPAAVGAHLAGEALLVAVVVCDRGEARRVAVEADRAERLALALVASDELRGEVLRLGGAAAVAHREQAATLEQAGSQALPPPGEPLELSLEPAERVVQRGEVLGGGGRQHEARDRAGAWSRAH